MVAAGLACLLRARVAGASAAPGSLIGAAILCWGASEVYWTAFILHDPSPPYPSPADVGYLAFYPLAARRPRPAGPRPRRTSWTGGCGWTALIAALGTAALGVSFVFDFVADHTTGTAAAGPRPPSPTRSATL